MAHLCRCRIGEAPHAVDGHPLDDVGDELHQEVHAAFLFCQRRWAGGLQGGEGFYFLDSANAVFRFLLQSQESGDGMAFGQVAVGLSAPGGAIDFDLSVAEAHDGAVVVQQVCAEDVLQPEPGVCAFPSAALAQAHHGLPVAHHYRRMDGCAAFPYPHHGVGCPQGETQQGGAVHRADVDPLGVAFVVAQHAFVAERVVVDSLGIDAEAAQRLSVGDVELVEQAAGGTAQFAVQPYLHVGQGAWLLEFPHAGNFHTWQ